MNVDKAQRVLVYKMKEMKPITKVDLKEPLNKGNGYTGYSCMFGASWHNNKEALENILKVAPQKIQDLRLVRSTKETTEHYGEKETIVENVRRHVFKYDFDGLFKVPWVVNAKVVGNDVVVDYEVLFSRPDQSLTYLLSHKKKAELRAQSVHPFSDYLYQKSRTRIDGLPVYLRIEEWQENNLHPKRVTLFRSGISSRSLDVKDGNSVRLTHTDRFHGSWKESWYVDVEKGKAKIYSLDICLKGSWSKNK